MKLKVTVKPHLKLEKEDKIYQYGEEFDVSEERGIEILKATYKGKTVVEYVSKNDIQAQEANDLIEENNKLKLKVKELEEKSKLAEHQKNNDDKSEINDKKKVDKKEEK
jgi:hypothetical protein